MISREEILTSEIRSLTLKQPYASLVLHGKQETRTWDSNYRGLLLITTSLRGYTWCEVDELSGLDNLNRILHLFDHKVSTRDLGSNKPIDFLPTGMAIAIVRMVDTISAIDFETPSGITLFEQRTFVEHNPGLFFHEYHDITPIVPFPYKGAQGMRRVTGETKQLIIPK